MGKEFDVWYASLLSPTKCSGYLCTRLMKPLITPKIINLLISIPRFSISHSFINDAILMPGWSVLYNPKIVGKDIFEAKKRALIK